MTKKLLLFGSVFALFLGCTKLDPKINAPSYLQIDGYTVITDSQSQGTNYQKFTDVLVTSRTTNYGYYPIPGKIPLPFNGDEYLIIRPVVKINGVGALRLDYPVMKGCDTTLPLVAGQVKHFTPIFKYYNSAVFRYKEDFSLASISMISSTPGDTFGVKHDLIQKCMLMRLDASHTVCQAQTTSAFFLPTTGTNVYLEISYKCNTAFELGIIGTSSPAGPLTDQRSAGGANPSAAWNKLYVNLTDLLRTPPYYPYYYIYFYTTYDTNTTTNEIYIDNIKVISQI